MNPNCDQRIQPKNFSREATRANDLVLTINDFRACRLSNALLNLDNLVALNEQIRLNRLDLVACFVNNQSTTS